MTKKVFNMSGGRHSQAALSAFINALYGTSVANGLNIVAPGGTGLKVVVKAGTANIDTGLGYGHMVQADADETITLAAASPSLPRNSLIVGYIDKSVSPTTTVIDNTNGIFKIKEIVGTPAASPQDPPASVIQSGVGATNPYIVFGRVRINANATALAQTSIMDMRKMVGLPLNGDYLENGSVSGSKIAQTTIKADNIDFTTMPIAGLIATKTDNIANNKKPLNIQCGRARILVPTQQPQPVEAIVEVQFPEIFKGGAKPVVLCTYAGYTANATDAWTDTPFDTWAGAAIGAVGVTNSSFKARIRRFDGSTLLGAYYFNWIAIG